ncbi:ankyrin repeat domain-containing protein [Fusarium mexicanum]|uniref:Ankyrin repeat domain-containing protein n=1 Tax=Fusarium mexicanum TaxID=751941 RepID=A0A8H5II09_9HYPO|nr:ankyrin repeat domain-containing protein [Fusarium mexicanum]
MGKDNSSVKGQIQAAFLLAAGHGHFAIVKLLLCNGTDADHQTTHGNSALREAAGKGHEKIVALLLDSGANVNTQVPYAGSVLEGALSARQIGVAKLLIARGAKPRTRNGGFSDALAALAGTD